MIAVRDAFQLAVLNIGELGDTDVFPLPVENHVLHDMPDETVAILSDIHDHFDDRLAANGPVNESALAMVGYTSFRWATQIDPIWNAYFLGLVLSLADDIEGARLPTNDERVFSYRYQPDSETKRLFSEGAWTAFQTSSANRAREATHVVACDIGDFYARIYHHRLENALQTVAPGSDIPHRILKLLSNFSVNTSYGLPVGGPAARILSELLLNRVDRLLVVEGVDFARFVDDYYLFVNSPGEAYDALLTLSDLLIRNEGLTLQRAKTRIMSGEEFLASSIFAPEGASAVDPTSRRFLTLSLRYDPYSTTAVEDFETLRQQVEEFDIGGMLTREIQKSRISTSLTRRLLQALRFTDPAQRAQIALSLVDSLENLAPVFTSVMRALREMSGELPIEATIEIVSKLRALIESGSHLAKIDVNLAYMIPVIAAHQTEENEALLSQIFERDVAAFVKRDVILVMASWGATYWLSDKKTRYAAMHAWVKRAFVIASYGLGDEGQHWRRAVRPSLAPFDELCRAWMEARVNTAGWRFPL